MAGRIHVGTSGWHYKHWLGVFYPEDLPAKDMLKFYSRNFPTVEINNTFYHLPGAATFEQWRLTTPKEFLFAVKGSRFITHMKKLKDPETSTEKFFVGAEKLGPKLGPVLFQLPPGWHLNAERLAEFLAVLPKGLQYAFEFRDESWHVRAVYNLLRRYNAAFCIFDLSGKETPHEITADFTYVRFHGPGEARYAGSYPSQVLENWAERLRTWRKDLADVYVYFNNDVGGHAIKNAQALRERLR
jgi:uncharacterized protein YecE (DUF72 family)